MCCFGNNPLYMEFTPITIMKKKKQVCLVSVQRNKSVSSEAQFVPIGKLNKFVVDMFFFFILIVRFWMAFDCRATQQVFYKLFTFKIIPNLQWKLCTLYVVHFLPVLDFRAALSPSIVSADGFVPNNCTDRTPGCVTNMVNSLKWKNLEDRRKSTSCACIFHCMSYYCCICCWFYGFCAVFNVSADKS
jgi:hypothetical protein